MYNFANRIYRHCLSYQNKYYPWSFIFFYALKICKHDEKISDVKFSGFDAIQKIDKFPFQSHICNNAEKMMWKIFTSTQASVYMYMRIYVCVFLNFVLWNNS